MIFNKNIKYKDILILALIGIIGYKLIDNYSYIFDFLKKITSIISPFLYAFVFAYILNPIMRLFENKLKLKRGMAILLNYLLIVGVIVLVLIFVIPSVIESIVSITSEIPTYAEIVQNKVNEIIQEENIYDALKAAGVLEYISSMSSKIGTIIISILEGSVSSIFSITTNFVKILFGFLISIYVLFDKEILLSNLKTVTYMILKKERAEKIITALKIYNEMIGIYVGTKALDSAIIAIIALIGLIIIKAPYAILLTIIVGFTNMIPYFGPLVGEVVGFIIGIFVSLPMAIAIFVFLLAVQQFDAWYLEPKLVGKKVGVRPFMIILGVTVGGGLFGAVGMILGSPTVATLKIAYDKKVKILKESNKEK
ncbi:AI-2E family transporter [uncultured Clostridium sp.]|uniref:AI-2E family transporter n=1 Tax=uncultured Clostridium sp. TaxID=59620 RepID=UPI0025F6CEDB|nr:AI-2E family transporter [uncultured Clostridium sp.]